MEKKLISTEQIKEKIISLFLFQKPYILSWNYRKNGVNADHLDYKAVKKQLAELVKEGRIRQIYKDSKQIEFEFIK